jgi:hypothetical protein
MTMAATATVAVDLVPKLDNNAIDGPLDFTIHKRPGSGVNAGPPTFQQNSATHLLQDRVLVLIATAIVGVFLGL